MTLEELVYQVDGELKVEETEGALTLSLLDKIRDDCVVRFRDERKQTEARSRGETLEEARQNLVELLKGNLLIHSWPVMWKSYDDILRVPETLTA